MRKRLVKNGNGVALPLDQVMCKLLGIDPNKDLVEYRIEGDWLMLRRSDMPAPARRARRRAPAQEATRSTQEATRSTQEATRSTQEATRSTQEATRSTQEMSQFTKPMMQPGKPQPPNPTVQSKKRTQYQMLVMMRELDRHGMTRPRFQRISPDGSELQDFVGNVRLGLPPNPTTVERLQRCLERRETCRESWDATIEAVLAQRTNVPRSRQTNVPPSQQANVPPSQQANVPRSQVPPANVSEDQDGGLDAQSVLVVQSEEPSATEPRPLRGRLLEVLLSCEKSALGGVG